MLNETQKTEWNSSKESLLRVHLNLVDCKSFMYADDWVGWIKALRALKIKAIVKMTPEQDEECRAWFNKLEEKVSVLARSRAKVSSFNTRIDNDLDEFEIWLRFICDKKGMLIADRERDSGL